MSLGSCHSCGATIGEYHGDGCTVERCSLCAGQRASCDCIYELSGIDVETMEVLHPEIYKEGPTEELWLRYDEEVAKYGGRIIWAGEWPGEELCREHGWYCKRVEGKGWIPCDADDPDATEDIDMVYKMADWDKTLRRFVLRSEEG